MSAKPTISIVIPCYNAAKWIGATLESALCQSYPPLEVILVDDGSTDESAQIAESFGPPVQVIRQANQGESVARNAGIQAASGEYLMFLDADDLLEATALEALSNTVQSAPGSVALMGCVWFSESPDKPMKTFTPEDKSFFPRIITDNLAPIHCWLVPRETVRRAGAFAGHLRWSEDWDLWNRVALLGPRLISIPFLGAFYRQHRQSQLATTKDADRARGHAAVTARLGQGMLQQPALLDAYGEQMFWALWTALGRCREKGVPWSELAQATAVLNELVVRGPKSVRVGRLSRLIRLLGARWAIQIHGLANRQSFWKSKAASL